MVYSGGIEFIISIYMVICISLIGYNIIFMFGKKKKDTVYQQRCKEMKTALEHQLACLEKGETLSEKEERHFVKKLCRVENLIAFDWAITTAIEEGNNLQYYFECYHKSIRQLCLHYQKKEEMQRACLAYVISHCYVTKTPENAVITDMLLRMVSEKNIYCRENALYALYSIGDEALVMEALRRLNATSYFHYSKLLTEGLLTFKGSHRQLIDSFWKERDMLRTELQVAVLNYIRFKTGGYEKQMYLLLQDKGQNEEIHYCAIRYLGKYAYPLAHKMLLYFLEEKEERWNYAAIAASALVAYPGIETVQSLKRATRNPSWFVRYNAAQSLINMGTEKDDLLDVLNGEDRFAREMLEFCMEEERHKGG